MLVVALPGGPTLEWHILITVDAATCFFLTNTFHESSLLLINIVVFNY